MKYQAPEVWTLILMSITTLWVYSFEPIMLFLCVRFPYFRGYMQKLFEDSDDRPNTKDARNALIFYSALWTLRLIVHIVMWMIVYGKDLLMLLGVVIGLFVLLLGIKKIEEKIGPGPAQAIPKE